MGQLRQSHAAGVAANQQIYFFIGSQLFDRADASLWVFSLVGGNKFKLASEHATFFVDVVHRHLDSGEGVAPDLQLHRGWYANANGLGIGGLCQSLWACKYAQQRA